MSSLYHFTDFLTEQILLQHELDVPSLVKNFNRNAVGNRNGSFVVPSEFVFRGKWCSQYLEALSFHSLVGVEKWIHFAGELERYGLAPATCTWEVVKAMAVLLGVECDHWEVPCLKLENRPETLVCKTQFVSAEEYCTINHIHSFKDFIKECIEIALYIVPIRPGIVGEVGLQLEDVAAYVTARLMQGSAEMYAGTDQFASSSFVSNFVNNFLILDLETNKEEIDDHLMNRMVSKVTAYNSTEPGSKRQQLSSDIESTARQILTTTHWLLGNNDDIIQQLDAAITFADAEKEYVRYVQREKVGTSLGYKLWKFYYFAEPRRAYKMAPGIDTTDCWWNRIISTTAQL